MLRTVTVPSCTRPPGTFLGTFAFMIPSYSPNVSIGSTVTVSVAFSDSSLDPEWVALLNHRGGELPCRAAMGRVNSWGVTSVLLPCQRGALVWSSCTRVTDACLLRGAAGQQGQLGLPACVLAGLAIAIKSHFWL